MCQRHYGETLRPTRPNEKLHFVFFLTMCKGMHGFCYVLVLKDGMSGFCELIPTSMANTEVTVKELLEWFKRYSVILWWISYQGSISKTKSWSNYKKCWVLYTISSRRLAMGKWNGGCSESSNASSHAFSPERAQTADWILDRTNFLSIGMFVLKMNYTNDFKADGGESEVVYSIARMICYRAFVLLS